MKKKILMTLSIITCAVALVVGSVAGTMAFLRSQAEISNTFTYGKVAIYLDESQLDKNGKQFDPPKRTQKNVGNEYMLVANTTYIKDPIIHIDPTSVPMYLFLKVDNGIAGLAVTEENTGKTIHEQLLANGWKIYKDEDNDIYQRVINIQADAGLTITQTSTIYYYSIGSDASQTDPRAVSGTVTTQVPTFATFTTGGTNVTEASMTAYYNHNAKIIITAYAVQSSGFEGENGIHRAAAVFADQFMNSATNPSATKPGSTLSAVNPGTGTTDSADYN